LQCGFRGSDAPALSRKGIGMKWIVLKSRNAKFPATFDAATERELMEKVQTWADERNYGELDFDVMTDQIDVFHFRGPKVYRFATLIPGE
jgi:hypothetical protein